MATVDGTSGGSPLVGRAAERAAVDGILADAKRGQGGSLVLTGQAGIGKSALVQYGAADIVHASTAPALLRTPPRRDTVDG